MTTTANANGAAKTKAVLIFDDECQSCSAIAQLIGARAPNIQRISFYSPAGQIMMRRHFPERLAVRPYLIVSNDQTDTVLSGARLFWQVARLLGPVGLVRAGQAWLHRLRRTRSRGGWDTASAQQVRGYSPASRAEAEALAGEVVITPDVMRYGLMPERVFQMYNLKGAIQTASYWKRGAEASLVLEQMHRPSPLPEIAGASAEAIDLGNGRRAQTYARLAGTGPEGTGASDSITMIVDLPDQRWLSLRTTGIDRETALAIARSCIFRTD